eukprot:TRINITY_DN2076_c0_g1_i2.p1 TRINITY_DN2076_c0_g1~~TRINITY_DN2076_c0_g1_i2.p1  ORF type:complete len:288 (-),score=46.94 TRINITY_DN2076_c0_g1_i2:171-959(-)
MTCSGVTPYLLSNDCAKQSRWIIDVLGAKEIARHMNDSGDKFNHLTLTLNGAHFYMADAACAPEEYIRSFTKVDESGGVQRGMHVYLDVEDVDATWKKALAAGATEYVALEDKFWGDRYGIFKAPWGYLWSVSTTIQKKEPTEHLQIQKLHQHAIVPTKPQNGKVGYGLYALEDTNLMANGSVEVDSGLSILLPKHTFGRIAPPSQMEEDLLVKNMVLDGSLQRLKIHIRNLSSKSKKIKQGSEIGRLVIEKSMLPEVALEE